METIHPACALVAAHMKAQEQCNATQRQESHNRNNVTGELTHLYHVVSYYFTPLCPSVTQWDYKNNNLFKHHCGLLHEAS